MSTDGIKPTRILDEGYALPDEVSIDGDYSGDDVDWDDAPGEGGQDQWKQPVRCATTASITIATALNAADVIDGVTLAAGDRVLVKDQSTASQNGIYVVGATPARAADMDDTLEVLGAVVSVIAGTVNAGSIWTVTNTTAPVVDTDAINWAAYPSATAHIADTSDAHDASAISVVDAGAYFAGTQVEAALQELGADVAAALVNPMTTANDIIIGGTAGAPARLAKGTDGQVLTVDPTTHDLLWATPGAAVQTTKGDLAGYSTVPARVPIGTDGQVLTADSAQALGLKWAAAPGGGVATDAIWDAKGDLAGGTGANTASRLAVGTNGQVLTADSAEATGLKWAAAGGGSDLVQVASGAGSVIIPGLAGSADTRVAGANDDEFDTTDTTDPMTGWTTMGTPTAHNINSTRKSHYYLKSDAAAGNAPCGIYKAAPAMPFTVTVCVACFVAVTTQGRVSLIVGEATPGKFIAFGFAGDNSRFADLVVDIWTNPTTYGSNPVALADVGGTPRYLRAVVSSSTAIQFSASLDGWAFRNFGASQNPSLTVGSVGLIVNRASGTQATEAYADWIRFS